MFKLKGHKGITLIALVITIIVLLILAGVTVAQITSQDGAPEKAAQARLENRRGEAKEAASIIVTELVQEYHEKKFVEGTTDATSAGEYTLETIEDQERTSGDFTISVEDDVLQVEDEEDVLATGTVRDDGVIVWDENLRVITPTASSVNEWNNLATESDVAPSDIFYYDITEWPETGKVNGVTENTKVADLSGNIKLAEETTNFGKADITGIDSYEMENDYSYDSYHKRYSSKNYNDYSDFENLYYKYDYAGAIGDYCLDYGEEYYYYDSDLGRNISFSNQPYNIDSNNYTSFRDILYVMDSYDYEEIIRYIYNKYRNSDSLSSYDYAVAGSVYASCQRQEGDRVYFDKSPKLSPVDEENSWDTILEYTWDEYNSKSEEDIKSDIEDYVEKHRSEFKTFYAERIRGDREIKLNCREKEQYFEASYFSTHLIGEYNNGPSYLEKFVIPSIYDGEYQITSVDLSEILPYSGNKIKELIIPNSVENVNFGYDDSYTETLHLDMLLIPSGMGIANNIRDYFPYGIEVKNVVLGEGITEVDASNLNVSGITDVYLPKSITNITGSWGNSIKVHYAGKRSQWKKVTGSKPQDDKVILRSTYTRQDNNQN